MMEQIESNLVIERTYTAAMQDLWALWTTKAGFQSWWGPQGFRVDVHTIEAREGGTLHYDMVADTPEMVAAMQKMGQPSTTPCRGHFATFDPHRRLVLTQVIDFLPCVPAYDSVMQVDFLPVGGDQVRMIVTLSQMHDAQMTMMQRQGMQSQLTKLDERYGWQG